MDIRIKWPHIWEFSYDYVYFIELHGSCVTCSSASHFLPFLYLLSNPIIQSKLIKEYVQMLYHNFVFLLCCEWCRFFPYNLTYHLLEKYMEEDITLQYCTCVCMHHLSTWRLWHYLWFPCFCHVSLFFTIIHFFMRKWYNNWFIHILILWSSLIVIFLVNLSNSLYSWKLQFSFFGDLSLFFISILMS
jgi:hypothetical protein